MYFRFSYSDIITFVISENFMNQSLEQFTIIERLKTMTQIEWFSKYADNGVIATWLNKYSVPFSLIMTKWGLCFNFNMISVEELLHVNDTSADFYYKADIANIIYISSMGANALYSDDPFPWKAVNSKRYLIIYFYGHNYVMENPFDELQGYHMIFHSNYEFPSAEGKNQLRIGTKSFTTIDINPVVYEADESLMELKITE
jgi:hypothetical protein